MIYPILRESRVVIEYEGRAFTMDALSSFSGSTSYGEYKSLRKTIHNRSNYAYSKIVQQEPSSISIQTPFTMGGVEGLLLHLLGWDTDKIPYEMPKFNRSVTPKMFNIYLCFKELDYICFTNCYLSAMDIVLEKSVPSISLGFESGNFYEGTYPPQGSMIQGDVMPFYPVSVLYDNTETPGLVSASISLQQQCEWIDNRSIHSIGTIYSNSQAYVRELNVSATVSTYMVSRLSGQSVLLPEYAPITIRNNIFSLNIPLARITKRADFSDVFKLEYDIIPTEDSDPVTISFMEKIR
ncbi:minor tail protein [Pectobacterium phage DU_PP_V]|uniref:Minor tail protein n=1 Tax=Pectobacterium phage DU_PP_V TaxID=2041492 RepID=A0A2D2W725_9CAUD|nr:base plate tail tube protein [Pectobacterium phage DU_PP_V]ATS94099.1 minor tail protein [Pectobacterium phage DU_PP_V]